MDSQVVFNAAVAISGALGGWVLRTIWTAIRQLDTDVKQLGREVHTDFVKREDFREATGDLKHDMRAGFQEIKAMMGEVFNKLDNKADKP